MSLEYSSYNLNAFGYLKPHGIPGNLGPYTSVYKVRNQVHTAYCVNGAAITMGRYRFGYFLSISGSSLATVSLLAQEYHAGFIHGWFML